MSELQYVLMRAYRMLEDAAYSEDGVDGDEAQAVMDELLPMLNDDDRATLAHEATVRESAPET